MKTKTPLVEAVVQKRLRSGLHNFSNGSYLFMEKQEDGESVSLCFGPHAIEKSRDSCYVMSKQSVAALIDVLEQIHSAMEED